MTSPTTLLTAALGLIMSALAAQSATIPITTVPYTISSPGTYVLTGNLTSPPLQNQSAILITGSAGTVVLDLQGVHPYDGGCVPKFRISWNKHSEKQRCCSQRD